MKKIERTKLRWAIESVEFASRGLMKRTGSTVRVSKIKISEKNDNVKADLDVFVNGVSTQIKNQDYTLSGLWAWINALCQIHLA